MRLTQFVFIYGAGDAFEPCDLRDSLSVYLGSV